MAIHAGNPKKASSHKRSKAAKKSVKKVRCIDEIMTFLKKSPSKKYTYKFLAKKLKRNTGAIGTAVTHMPKNLQNRIITDEQAAA